MKRKQFILAASALCLILLMLTVSASAEETGMAELMGSFEGAIPIDVNEEQKGALLSGSDSYYYIFSLDQPGVVSVTFSHDFVESGSYYWNVRFYEYNEMQNELFSQHFKGNERDPQTTTNVGLPAGRYYAVIDRRNCDWSNATYRFTINFKGSDAWEKENNDSLEKSTAIPVNREISGSIMRADDKDYYLIELPSDGFISVDFSHDYIDANQYNWSIWLYEYKDTENALFSQHFKGNEHDPQTTTNVGLPAGQYYLAVNRRDCDWSDVTYRFTVNFTGSDAWEKENNGGRMTATQIYFNKEVRGTVMMSGDKDYYTFTLAREDNVSISFGHEYVDDTRNYWNLKLYSENDIDQPIHSSKYTGTERNNLTSGESALSAGKYYLCIERSEWSSVPYTLTVNAKSQEGIPQPFEQKFIINGVTVSDADGNVLNAIPNGDFRATVTITNLIGGGESWVLLASYTKEGQFVDFTWARTKNFSVGGTFDLTVPIRNPSGKIGQLKAFTVSSLTDLTPLGNSASFPAV